MSGIVSGYVLGPAMAWSGSSMTMSSFCLSDLFSVTHWSKLGTCSGWGATVLLVVIVRGLRFCAVRLAASFQVVPSNKCSVCRAAYGLIISSTNCVVSPALSLSHCMRDDRSRFNSSGGHFSCVFSRMQPLMLPFWLNKSFVNILNQFFKTDSFQNWSCRLGPIDFSNLCRKFGL